MSEATEKSNHTHTPFALSIFCFVVYVQCVCVCFVLFLEQLLYMIQLGGVRGFFFIIFILFICAFPHLSVFHFRSVSCAYLSNTCIYVNTERKKNCILSSTAVWKLNFIHTNTFTINRTFVTINHKICGIQLLCAKSGTFWYTAEGKRTHTNTQTHTFSFSMGKVCVCVCVRIGNF